MVFKTCIFVLLICFFIVPLNAPAFGEARPYGRQERFDFEGKSLSAPTPTLMAPLRTGGNNLFHSLILIPTLETAELLDEGQTYLQSGIDRATGDFTKDKNGWLLDYEAHLIEAFVDLRYGISERLEIKAGLTGGILNEAGNELVLLENNTGYLAGEREFGLSDVILGIKFRLIESSDNESEFPYTSTLGIWLKQPLAKNENVLSSGGTDLAIAYIETDKIEEDLYVHTQIGYTLTGTETVFEKNLDISNTLFYGAGLSWHYSENLALIGQIQGNTNAFGKIKSLNKHPLAVQGGFRYRRDKRFFIEGSIGFGLNTESADSTMMFSLGMIL